MNDGVYIEKKALLHVLVSIGVIGGCLFLGGLCVGIWISEAHPQKAVVKQTFSSPHTISTKTRDLSHHERKESFSNQKSAFPHPHPMAKPSEQEKVSRPSSPQPMAKTSGPAKKPLAMSYNQQLQSWDARLLPLKPSTPAHFVEATHSSPTPLPISWHSIDESPRETTSEQHPPFQGLQRDRLKEESQQVNEELFAYRKASPSSGPYLLQVGTFLNGSEASAMEKKLLKKGYAAFVVARHDLRKRRWYQVGIGSFFSHRAAAQAAHRVQEKEGFPALIRTERSYFSNQY